MRKIIVWPEEPARLGKGEHLFDAGNLAIHPIADAIAGIGEPQPRLSVCPPAIRQHSPTWQPSRALDEEALNQFRWPGSGLSILRREVQEGVPFIIPRSPFHGRCVIGNQCFSGAVPFRGNTGERPGPIVVLSQYGRLRPVNAVLREAIQNTLAVAIFVRDAVGPHEEQLSLLDCKILMVTEFVALLGCSIEDLVFSFDRRKAEHCYIRLVQQATGDFNRRGICPFVTTVYPNWS